MKHFILIVIIALASVSLQSCSGCKNANTPAPDNPYGLPNATQTGAGVFACRINGVNYIAKNDIYHMGAGVKNDTLGIDGSFKTGRFYALISIGIYGNIVTNYSYNLADTIHTYCLFGTDSTCQQIVKVTNIYPKDGSIFFTKVDTVHTFKIVSGIFSLKIPIPGCDTLNVTDGRFDIGFN